MAMQVVEEILRKKCRDRGMTYNSLTRLLVKYNKTAYRLSHDLGIPQPTVSRLTHVEEKDMISWASCLFRILGKLDAMGYDIWGLF